MLNNLRAFHQVMRDIKLPRAKLNDLINKRLREVLVSAYLNVPYYREVMRSVGYDPKKDYSGPSDLQVLPITTKEDIKERGITSFIREGTNLSKVFSDSTSGSTGIPLRIYKTRYERAVQIAKWLRVLFVNGYSLNHKVMAPVSPDRAKEGRSLFQKFGILRRLPIDYLHYSPKEMVDIFLSYNPDVLYGNRSHLDLMALELKQRKIKPEKFNLKLLISTAEVICDSNRKLYRKQFGIELTDTYGSVEMGTMAYETRSYNGLRLAEDLTFFEFLDKNNREVSEGEPGRVIVTDLIGKLMPFIRYDQGDWIFYDKVKCLSGAMCLKLKRIIGRENDFALLPDKTRIPAHDLYKLVAKFDDIVQYRIVQRNLNLFEILIVADTPYFLSIREEVMGKLRKRFPLTVNFEVKQVNKIDPDPTGKIRTFVSNVL